MVMIISFNGLSSDAVMVMVYAGRGRCLLSQFTISPSKTSPVKYHTRSLTIHNCKIEI